MQTDDNLNVGIVFGDMLLLTAYAQLIGANPDKLKRQASRCGALIDAAGVFYVNVPLFLQKRQVEQEARAKRRSESASQETIETTTRVGLLRGQKTRITRINLEIQARLDELSNLIRAEADRQKRSDLETEQGHLMSRLASNNETLAKVQRRLNELQVEPDSGGASPEPSPEEL